jgi:hypothetical protein
VFELDGSAASTADSEQEVAVQLEPVQDCAIQRVQSRENTSNIRGKESKQFLLILALSSENNLLRREESLAVQSSEH